MFIMLRSKYFLLISILLLALNAKSQLPFDLIDNREHKYCAPCKTLIEEKPIEVLFGVHVNTDGNIYFSMNNMEWFNKIFKNKSYGVTIDLVPKSRYACGKQFPNESSLPKGTMLLPIYRPELLKGQSELTPGSMFVKIGTLPKSLLNKELEGNLVILNGNFICYYSNFVNIDRTALHLLPMGLFTDSLVQDTRMNAGSAADFLDYTKKVQFEVPFEKSGTGFSNSYISRFLDSVELSKYIVRRTEVRAYSSVEGTMKMNEELMAKRADTIIAALNKYQPLTGSIKIITAENWLSFFKDLEETKFSHLQDLSKLKIKQKLTDKNLLNEIEPLLSKQRKAVVTLYLESKSPTTFISNTSILSDFKNAIAEKNISKAKLIQQEIAERIRDNQLPLDYIHKLEVPKTKEFSSLLNDREVYKFLLKASSEYEALDNFLALKQLDPGNGRISYNICALRFFMWQHGDDSLTSAVLFKEINTLSKLGINGMLVKRMLVNYHIMKCDEDMAAFRYDAKDSSLEVIHTIYDSLKLNDEDIYTLAKYYSYYGQQNRAEEIILPRIGALDVSEDLIFYYVNLQFFNSGNYDTEDFRTATLNAINLNRKRFCHFFDSNDRGGASMQLLGNEIIKDLYCEECLR